MSTLPKIRFIPGHGSPDSEPCHFFRPSPDFEITCCPSLKNFRVNKRPVRISYRGGNTTVDGRNGITHRHGPEHGPDYRHGPEQWNSDRTIFEPKNSSQKARILYQSIFEIFESSSNVWSCLFQNLDSKKFVENRKRTGINVFRALNYYVFIYRSSHREIIGLSHWKESSLSNPNIVLVYRDMIRYFNLMKNTWNCNT